MYEFIEAYFFQIIITISSICIWIVVAYSNITFNEISEISENTEHGVVNKVTKISTQNIPKKHELISNEITLEKREKIKDTNKVFYIVKRVIDGDTIDIGFNKNIRILGIDSPESNNIRYGYSECYGENASKYTSDILLGKKITIEKDTIQPEYDKYGRYLLHIWIDNELFSEKIINAGYAKRYTKAETKYTDILILAEGNAKQNKIGLWGECAVTD